MAIVVGLVTPAAASTTIQFTRAEIAQMARLWETDTFAISNLANAQYPQFSGAWQFIFPHRSISGDGDIHVDMGLDSAGNGASGNNTSESPIVCEVINANSSQLNEITAQAGRQATFRGIFRLYTEHASERHFELHPVLERDGWNGSAFVPEVDYHGNVVPVPDGSTHASSTLVNLLNGSQTITATITSDNASANLLLPSPSVNYVQYDGTALSSVISDAVSDYFLFRPSIVPSATVKCRIIAHTAEAMQSSSLRANQSVTVNALTRTDMAAIATRVASLNAGQSDTFARPIEFILLGLPAIGPAPAPTPAPTSPSLLNVATRAQIGTGDNVLIAGVIVQGSGTKKIMLRAIGPSLSSQGVSGALRDPFLELHDRNGVLIGMNDNWRVSQPGGVVTSDQAAEIQATNLAPSDDAESALIATLVPDVYTSVVGGVNGATGIGVAEVYDIDQNAPAHLANLSSRGVVRRGDDVLIGGFIVANQPTKVVLRAIGPSLTNQGVPGALADPTLELHDVNGVLIAANDNWRSDQETELRQSGLAPTNELEAAMVKTLAPGNYTAIVSGHDAASGIALVEIYNP
ncbi:MAG: hypothetical protein ABR526_06340 [Chthoniobacterales bacterium]